MASGSAVQTNGLGARCAPSTKRLIASWSATSEGKLPRSQALLGELGEEGLDRVQPGARGRGEVEGPARVARQPGQDLGVLVGAVVVHVLSLFHNERKLPPLACPFQAGFGNGSIKSAVSLRGVLTLVETGIGLEPLVRARPQERLAVRLRRIEPPVIVGRVEDHRHPVVDRRGDGVRLRGHDRARLDGPLGPAPRLPQAGERERARRSAAGSASAACRPRPSAIRRSRRQAPGSGAP